MQCNGSAQTGAVLGRNYLRVKSLAKWWSRRGGRLKEAGNRAPNTDQTHAAWPHVRGPSRVIFLVRPCRSPL